MKLSNAMTFILASGLMFAGSMLSTWVFAAFLFPEAINPMSWEPGQRFVWVLASACVSLFAAIAAAEVFND